MDNDTNLVTQDSVNDDQRVVDSAVAGGNTNDGTPSEPFLQVNERTSYKTADEAKAGFAEAQKTITSLSGMKSLIEGYVGKGNTSNEVIKQLFDELVANRAEKAAAAAAKAKGTPSGGDEDPRFEGKSADEIKAIKAADKWYKDQADKNGFVSKTELEKLQAELAELKGAPEKQFEAANNDAVRGGREYLDSLLAGAKIALTDAESKKLTARIAAYVDGDEELVGRWQNAVRSGNRAEREAIVKEAAEFALPSVKPGASLKAALNSVKTKAQLVQRTTRPLPQPGNGRGNDDSKKPASIMAQPRGLRSKELNAKADAFLTEALAAQE